MRERGSEGMKEQGRGKEKGKFESKLPDQMSISFVYFDERQKIHSITSIRAGVLNVLKTKY